MTSFLVLLEVLTRLAAVATLLAIPRDPRVAAWIALASAASALLRAFVRGAARSRELSRCWAMLVQGIRGRDVRDLSSMREDEESVAMLSNAASEVAIFRSTSVPDVIADAVALLALLLVAATKAPPLWMALAAVVAVPVALVIRAVQRRQFAALQNAYATHGTLTRDTRALIEASSELRAQDSENAFAEGMIELARRMARSEEKALRFGAALGMAPIGLALVALLLPSDFAQMLIRRAGLLDIGIIGGALLASGLGLVRSIEAMRRIAPYRAALARMTPAKASATSVSEKAQLTLREIRFHELSVVHPGADHATPASLSMVLKSGGLALTGVNGSGKSTAIAALLGLVPASSGSVMVNGDPLDEARSRALNRLISYLPQSPFVSAGDTLRWHAAIMGVDGDTLLGWLERFGLTATLSARAKANGHSVIDLKMGSLSGGEQQRFFLARTLARPADLVVLDEPEAALDEEGRASLGQMLEELAKEKRVVVIAHDVGFVPASFQQVECVARQIAADLTVSADP